ncbi:SWIM zinc finger family protein [Streptomyces sp. 8N706]|uniref:SWIM zinc finger family protein n=1 Tax=Streptomyces sp. 8N706 TaxID=3457416 RepID=UPI003FD1C7C0
MSDGADSGARGFPAFAARKGGRVRGQSWWGRAWVEAMEDGWPEEEPLKKGRAFARSGRIGPLTVSAGRVAAQVYDGADDPYTAVLTVPALGDDQWDALWEKTASRPAGTEALLAGELPPDLLEAAEDARLGLLPGYGDLEPDCDCAEPDHPCAHAVALGYQFSWLLDADPQVLLLVRGREWAVALDELKSAVLLRAMSDAREGEEYGEAGEEHEADAGKPADGHEATAARGTPAAEAYARPAVPLPALPPLPEPPEQAAESVTGIAADPLERLVTDAAVRARDLLAYVQGVGAEPPQPLDGWQDTVRLAATHPDPRVPQRLREACDEPERLDRAAAAWRNGGAAGLEVLEHRWEPPQPDVARARTMLAAGWAEDEVPELVNSGNHWTLTGRGLQLRYGRDGRWYPYRETSGAWTSAGRPTEDPALALAELLDD